MSETASIPKIGAFLGRAIKRANLSHEFIGEKLGKSRVAVWNWVHDKNLPEGAALYQLAVMLDFSLDEMFNLRTNEKPSLLAAEPEPPKYETNPLTFVDEPARSALLTLIKELAPSNPVIPGAANIKVPTRKGRHTAKAKNRPQNIQNK